MASQLPGAPTLTVSPNTVSNGYTGTISLNIAGLQPGEPVLVEQFADFNGNGTVEATDLTMQAFPLKDGEATVIGGITNLHVPGDLNSAAGTITAQLYMGVLSFEQRAVGKRVYRVSSPTSRFSPVTAAFTITNSAYAGQVSGRVTSSGTNVPYALVVLFQPSDEDVNPKVAGASDASGNYSLKVPPGVYLAAAFKSNYVSSFDAAPIVDVTSPGAKSADLSLLPAKWRISGRVSDRDDSLHGLGGLLMVAESPSGKVAVGTTDRNGNFTVGVTADLWRIGPEDTSLHLLGYPGVDNHPGVDCTQGNATGLSITIKEGEAMFYGRVRTDTSAPLNGLQLYGQDSSQEWSLTPATDDSGRYFAPVPAGAWEIGIDHRDNLDFGNYIFSLAAGSISIPAGSALLQDFTAKSAPYLISGFLKNTTQMPIGGVQIWGVAEINGLTYGTRGMTDGSGFFQMRAANGQWNVGAACDGEEGLRPKGYSCMGGTLVTVANGNAAVSLVATPCTGLSITSGALPNGRTGEYYSQWLQAESCGGNLVWTLKPDSGRLPNGISLNSMGQLSGTPTETGTLSFTVRVSDDTSTAEKPLALTVEGNLAPLEITTWGLVDAMVGTGYISQLTANGGRPPYAWSLSPGSAALPQNLSLSASGQISGTPAVAGQFYFRVRVTDSNMATADQQMSLMVSPQIVPLNITSTILPTGTVGVAYSALIGATGGQPPYRWNMAIGSAPVPPGLSLNGNTGEIFGTPTTAGTFYFIVNLNDSAVITGADEQLLTLTINSGQIPRPSLSFPSVNEGKFRFSINGADGARCTIEFSTDLVTWTEVRTTNAPAIFEDDGNRPAGFYRVVVAP